MLTRRKLIQSAACAGFLTGIRGLLPAWGQSLAAPARLPALESVNGVYDLAIAKRSLEIGNTEANATLINQSLPGPLLRFREGETITLRVSNHMEENSSLHWHGILLPAQMDGVPGVSFSGIGPGETFTYEYPLKQSGTYWYHSHSGLQEQSGVFGPIIIDPTEGDPVAYDREFVIMLSDWTFENPDTVFAKLKKSSDYYNYNKRTLADLFRDSARDGLGETLEERMMWGRMRMDPTDIADITGATYTYLLNGNAPQSNWTGLFRPGEKVRLRFINAAAMTYFNVRIPGLEMTVVQADGQNVKPVTVEEFQISVAETYDVIVRPKEDSAYTIFAETTDRSGYARGTLAPRLGMAAAVPELRPAPLRGMADMGINHKGMGHMRNMGGMKDHAPPPALPKHPATPGGPSFDGPGVAMKAMAPANRLHEPGVGLHNTGHRVLVYGNLRSLEPFYDQRLPTREMELHLTGNMKRYIWSFDGKKFNEVTGPIAFRHGERLRLTMINNTMMDHPIHLHGMWMELDNGTGKNMPRKHTINVKPGEKLSVVISADAPGNWAFHCHLLYHMKAGMFRVVSVSDQIAETES